MSFSVYLPEELPAGCAPDGTGLGEWWNLRAIPDSRKGIRQVLSRLSEETSQSLMLSSYGLSLTDHYWVQPVGSELYWKDLNFYENDFTDEPGRYPDGFRAGSVCLRWDFKNCRRRFLSTEI